MWQLPDSFDKQPFPSCANTFLICKVVGCFICFMNSSKPCNTPVRVRRKSRVWRTLSGDRRYTCCLLAGCRLVADQLKRRVGEASARPHNLCSTLCASSRHPSRSPYDRQQSSPFPCRQGLLDLQCSDQSFSSANVSVRLGASRSRRGSEKYVCGSCTAQATRLVPGDLSRLQPP